jgi:hypothetical protein
LHCDQFGILLIDRFDFGSGGLEKLCQAVFDELNFFSRRPRIGNHFGNWRGFTRLDLAEYVDPGDADNEKDY